jgi:hypothetical protein
MVELAQDFGIRSRSRQALKKTRIPVPGRGYWARVPGDRRHATPPPLLAPGEPPVIDLDPFLGCARHWPTRVVALLQRY